MFNNEVRAFKLHRFIRTGLDDCFNFNAITKKIAKTELPFKAGI